MSVVIVAYNEEKYIEQCLLSVIERAEWYIDEIVVVDNNSKDTTLALVEKIKAMYQKQSSPAIIVVSEMQQWVTHARQKWYTTATWDIIVFHDADIIVPAWYYKKIYDIFAHDNKIGFLSGPYSYYDATRWQRLFGTIYWRVSYVLMYGVGGYLWVWWNMILRRTVLDKMQWFDTNIVFYGDDTDTAYRAKKFGRVVFSSAITLPSSFRRFAWTGIIKTLYLYWKNSLSSVLFKKPLTKYYDECR